MPGAKRVPLHRYRKAPCQQYQTLIIMDNQNSPRSLAMPSSYAVGEHFEQFIKRQVEGGRYTSASEVVRDALRLLEEEQQRREATL
ncbi:MAG: type II toxin-antitoxin system ParD family antitoxin, partial [Gammaproteobacteria bacterium]